jgi:hypothetical protein
MDIIKKIDTFLKDAELENSINFIEKDKAIFVIESIMKSIPEDQPLLEMIKTSIEQEWKNSNVKLIEKFNKILCYYGIQEYEESTSFRKTILEKKGKTLVRKFVTIDNLEEIKKVLKK